MRNLKPVIIKKIILIIILVPLCVYANGEKSSDKEYIPLYFNLPNGYHQNISIISSHPFQTIKDKYTDEEIKLSADVSGGAVSMRSKREVSAGTPITLYVVGDNVEVLVHHQAVTTVSLKETEVIIQPQELDDITENVKTAQKNTRYFSTELSPKTTGIEFILQDQQEQISYRKILPYGCYLGKKVNNAKPGSLNYIQCARVSDEKTEVIFNSDRVYCLPEDLHANKQAAFHSLDKFSVLAVTPDKACTLDDFISWQPDMSMLPVTDIPVYSDASDMFDQYGNLIKKGYHPASGVILFYRSWDPSVRAYIYDNETSEINILAEEDAKKLLKAAMEKVNKEKDSHTEATDGKTTPAEDDPTTSWVAEAEDEDNTLTEKDSWHTPPAWPEETDGKAVSAEDDPTTSWVEAAENEDTQ